MHWDELLTLDLFKTVFFNKTIYKKYITDLLYNRQRVGLIIFIMFRHTYSMSYWFDAVPYLLKYLFYTLLFAPR